MTQPSLNGHAQTPRQSQLRPTLPHASTDPSLLHSQSSDDGEADSKDRGLRLAVPRRGHFLLLTGLAAGFVFYGSVVPLQVRALGWADGLNRFAAVLTDSSGLPQRADFSTNVLLFMPCAFVMLASLLTDRHGVRRSLVAVVLTLLLCTALSLISELAQIWVPARYPSRFDVAAHVLGSIFGIAIWLLAGPRIVNWLRLYSAGTSRSELIDWLLCTYLGGLVVFSVLPLDLVVHPRELYFKFARGQVQLTPFQHHNFSPAKIWELVLDVLVYVPVGVLARRIFRRIGQPLRSLTDSFLLGLLVVVAVEISQLFVISRYTDSTDLLTGGLGILLGALLAAALPAQAASHAARADEPRTLLPFVKWTCLTTVYLCGLCLLFWSPLEPIGDRELIRSRLNQFLTLPLQSIHRGTVLEETTLLLRKTLLFAPLGLFLAHSLSRLHLSAAAFRLLLLAGFGVIVLCTAAIELVQSVFPPHLPDVTDTLLYCVGSLLGIGIWLKVAGTAGNRFGPS